MADSDEYDDDDLFDDDEPERPRAKNTVLTLVLCLLNVLAALGFTYLLVMSFQKRKEWSYHVFLHDLWLQGLPLQEEEDAPSASRATARYPKLSSEQIKAVFSQRPGTKGATEFLPVDEDMVAQVAKTGAFIPPAYIHNRIVPSYLTPEILKDYFGNLGKEVVTLEDEVLRLKAQVPADFEAAAKTAVAGAAAEDDKRKLAARMLLPLAYDVFQVQKLDKKLSAAKGAELDRLAEDAVQRRMILDILGPFEMYRPGDAKIQVIEKAADIESFPLDDLKNLLKKRFDVAIAEKFAADVHLGEDWEGKLRTTIEKRMAISFLLTAIANVRKPDDTFLYPPQSTNPPQGTPNVERAQTVLGVLEFTGALHNLATAYDKMEEKVVAAIIIDREGYEVQIKNEIKRYRGAFEDKYRDEIKRIKDLQQEIRAAQERLAAIQKQRDAAKTLVEDRQTHLDETHKRLIASRADTAKRFEELRRLQLQLFEAQVELSDAAENLFRLEKEIRGAERKLQGKGAVTP